MSENVEKKAKALLALRQKNLKSRRVAQIADSLGRLSEQWLVKNNLYRRAAVKSLVNISGFSPAMASAMLDALFSELTREKLAQLIVSEVGDGRFLDGFCPDRVTGIRRYAEGPALITHIFSANLPNPAVMSLVHGLLVKSANAVKLSGGDPGILPFYLRSLKAHDAGLFSAVHALDPDDRGALRKWIGRSDLVVAYGSDETIAHLRRQAGPEKKMIAYGHRVSFSLYTRGALTRKNVHRLAAETALDVWMADQRGCLSPSVIYAGLGGEVAPVKFAEEVALALDRLATAEKNFPMKNERNFEKEKIKLRWKVRKTAGETAHFWESAERGRWAAFYDQKPGEFPLSCGAQTFFIRGFNRTDAVYRELSQVRRYLQACALEAAAGERDRTAAVLASLGVNRVTRAGRLQCPPAAWHHDGSPNFSNWLRWTDLE